MRRKQRGNCDGVKEEVKIDKEMNVTATLKFKTHFCLFKRTSDTLLQNPYLEFNGALSVLSFVCGVQVNDGRFLRSDINMLTC